MKTIAIEPPPHSPTTTVPRTPVATPPRRRTVAPPAPDGAGAAPRKTPAPVRPVEPPTTTAKPSMEPQRGSPAPASVQAGASTADSTDPRVEYHITQVNALCADDNRLNELREVLIAAKNELKPRRKWTAFLESGKLKIGSRYSDMIVRVGEHPVLGDLKRSAEMPSSVDALYALSKLDGQAVVRYIESKQITAKTTIKEARKLVKKHFGSDDDSFDKVKRVAAMRSMVQKQFGKWPPGTDDEFKAAVALIHDEVRNGTLKRREPRTRATGGSAGAQAGKH